MHSLCILNPKDRLGCVVVLVSSSSRKFLFRPFKKRKIQMRHQRQQQEIKNETNRLLLCSWDQSLTVWSSEKKERHTPHPHPLPPSSHQWQFRVTASSFFLHSQANWIERKEEKRWLEMRKKETEGHSPSGHPEDGFRGYHFAFGCNK